MGKNKERGVTLVETVVAMALILIVAASVFFTCNYSIRMQSQNRIKHFFIGEAENVAMCYYSDDFSSALSFLTGSSVDITNLTSYTIYYDSDLGYTFDEQTSTYGLEIDFSSTDIKIVVKNISSGKQIYTYGGSDEN